ncbi:shikimate kinase [Croceitalea marina]|uniref:Shikimate kinase n=1 Tax=Croceitalea marina TaxID=1775166 RepID=A0ABW5MQA6_9FLAO
MKVVLVGYMASGKSTIGKELANTLRIDFVDLDKAIAEEAGLSITELFKKKGELFFRKTEALVLEKLLHSNKSFVLATGGGTPCYGNNMKIITENASTSVYLKLSIPSLLDRISKEKETRPLVAGIANDDLPEFVGKHLFERSMHYQKADSIVTCEAKTVNEVVEEIKEVLG